MEWNSLKTLVSQVLICALWNSVQTLGTHSVLRCFILCLLPTPSTNSSQNTGVHQRILEGSISVWVLWYLPIYTSPKVPIHIIPSKPPRKSQPVSLLVWATYGASSQ